MVASDVLDDLAAVHLAAAELELAAEHPRQVEQVVDQPRLELDVAPDHRQLARVGGQAGVHLEAREHGEHRRQRRAQLVAEGRQEAVLGLVGGLGLAVGPLELLPRALAVADVDRAADHPHRPAAGVAHDEPLVPGMEVAAVAVPDAVLDAEGGAAAGDGAVDLVAHAGDVLGVDLPLPPVEVGGDLLGPVAEQFEGALRALDGVGVDRPVVDQAADRLGGEAEALLALAQRRFDPQGLGGHLGLGEQVALAQRGLAPGPGGAQAGGQADRQRARGERLDEEIARPHRHAVQAEGFGTGAAQQEDGQVAGPRVAAQGPQQIETVSFLAAFRPGLDLDHHHVGAALAEGGPGRLARRGRLDLEAVLEIAGQHAGTRSHPEKAVSQRGLCFTDR